MANYSTVTLRVAEVKNDKGKVIKKVDEKFLDLLMQNSAMENGILSDEENNVMQVNGRWSYDHMIKTRLMKEALVCAYICGYRKVTLRYVDYEEGDCFAGLGELDCVLYGDRARITKSTRRWDAEDFLEEFGTKPFPDLDDYEDNEDQYDTDRDAAWETLDGLLDSLFLYPDTFPVNHCEQFNLFFDNNK